MTRTLEPIRASLPTHILLVPGAHFRKDGDEIVTMSGHVRRPVPPHILDNQAFWLKLGTFWESLNRREPDTLRTPLDYLQSLDEDLDDYGGSDAVVEHYNAGRLYDTWLLEQIES